MRDKLGMEFVTEKSQKNQKPSNKAENGVTKKIGFLDGVACVCAMRTQYPQISDKIFFKTENM